MVIIANPIYDTVFKYMLEDERVARVLLSALLKKEVVELQMRRHEYTNTQQRRISLFRIDFSAKVRDADGKENLVLIELQKTWLATETLRFRQYLGAQYADELNLLSEDNPKGFGLPIISIYILGHKVGNIKNPVIYVRRNYFDYDDTVLTEGVPDPFIESLTHDSIIVQLPYLKAHARNRLERILTVFDQKCRYENDLHLLNIDDECMEDDERLVVKRLTMAAVSPEVRRSMQVEDEFLSELEERDTKIMMTENERDAAVEEKKAALEERDAAVSQYEEMKKSAARKLAAKGMGTDEISIILSVSKDDVEEMLK